MLHIKFHCSRPNGSGEFVECFSIYGRGWHVGFANDPTVFEKKVSLKIE